ncbi:MAG: hypothetical protein FWE68_00160 [Defluviitaleaceae bacterium]|nr:hypothetical protein [Defluviitaleaceae bacterium]
MPTSKKTLAAVIDIGSNELRLKIAQRSKESTKYLESLTYDLSLGRDTFDTGKISFEKIDKACDVINNFRRVAEGYGIRNVRITATTAVREAANREYIIDQIKIKTNTLVKVYDDMEEKQHIYRLMTFLLGDMAADSALMVYNGSGNLGVSLITDGRVSYVQNIKTGPLRISETFEEVQEYSNEFRLVIDEYLTTFMTFMLDEMPKDIAHFIVSGHEMPMIAELCGCPAGEIVNRIPRRRFEELYGGIKNKTTGRLAEDYGVTPEKADLLLPAVIFCYKLMRMTKCEEIIFPAVFLSDALLFEELYPEETSALIKGYNKNILQSARTIAAKYRVPEPHYKTVVKFAGGIFDQMKKIHGLGSREKALLQAAAILRDVGKFVNMTGHHLHSYNIVLGCDIVGLSDLEKRIVANLCYYHSSNVPHMSDANYAAFRPSERVLVSKLAAILKLASALDRSHLQKFETIDVNIGADALTITALTNANADLERWAFSEKAAGFFEEVFGIKAVFKQKRVI